MDKQDTLANHPYKHMPLIKRHYELNDKFRHLLDRVFIIDDRTHIYAGCNDKSYPYFRKVNRKKRYTIPGIDSRWLFKQLEEIENGL